MGQGAALTTAKLPTIARARSAGSLISMAIARARIDLGEHLLHSWSMTRTFIVARARQQTRDRGADLTRSNDSGFAHLTSPHAYQIKDESSHCRFQLAVRRYRGIYSTNCHNEWVKRRWTTWTATFSPVSAHNARAPVAELARALGISRTTVQSRLVRLERTGVIAGYAVKLSEAREAAMIHAFKDMLTVEPKQAAAVTTALRSMVGVRKLQSVSGPFDMIAVAVEASPSGRWTC